MYEAKLRILSWDNTENVLISWFKSFRVNNAEGFQSIFDTYCRKYLPDVSGNNCPDKAFMDFEDPERCKEVINDIAGIK